MSATHNIPTSINNFSRISGEPVLILIWVCYNSNQSTLESPQLLNFQKQTICTRLILFILFGLLLIGFKPLCAQTILRVAILENFTSTSVDPKVATSYATEYNRGLILAQKTEKKQGVRIVYKFFLYDDSPLSILNKVQAVKAWHPDLLIGPRQSRKFLLLEKHFKNTLVISPMASSQKVEVMPTNFYSLSLSSKYMGLALFQLYQRLFKNKNVFSITQAGCKYCQEVTDQFSILFHKHKIKQKIINKDILENSMGILNMSHFMPEVSPNTIFLMPNPTNVSFVMIVKTLGFLNRPVIFLGDDNWGGIMPKQVAEIKRFKSNFIGYRITFWPSVYQTKIGKKFIYHYRQLFHNSPSFSISSVIYRLILSVTTAYRQYKPLHSPNINRGILLSYEKAKKINPYWFKSTNYAVYKTKNGKTKVIGHYDLLDHR